MYRIILLLGLLALASPAYSADLTWKDTKTDSDLSKTENMTTIGYESTYLVPDPGKSYYVAHTGAGASTDQSLVINTLPCAAGGILEFFADATGTEFAATGVVYYCPTGTGATSGIGCTRLLTDINDDQIGVDDYEFTGDPGMASDPDGNTFLDNRAWITDIKNPLIFVTWVDDPGVGVTSIWKYTCPAK